MPIVPENSITGAEIDGSRGRSSTACRCGLRERIECILSKNPIGLIPEGHYLPDDELESLLTAGAVQSALGGNVDPSLVDFILQKAKKTFATLVLVFKDFSSREKAMNAFRRVNFTDEELVSPLSKETPGAALVLCEAYPCKRGGGTCLHNFPLDDPWDLTNIRDFKSKRWHFLVPTFDHNHFEYEFDGHRLLPFTTKVSLAELNNGTFSEVTCVEMLADKQTKISSSDKTIVVALKTLKRINEPRYIIHSEWRREANAHKQLNGTHDHIIRAIAAYRQIAADSQNDVYHLVLEWADGGSLLSFWKKNRQPQVDSDIKRSRKRVMLVLKQFYGLADALKNMHATSAKSLEPSECNTTRSPDIFPEGDVPRSTESIKPPSLATDEFSLPRFNFEAPNDLQEAEGDSPSHEPSSTSVDEFPPLPSFSFQGPVDPQKSEEGASRSKVSPVESSGRNEPGAECLQRWNSQSSSGYWRHGDIKPENILRFTSSKENVWIGTLKLADFGRAQKHLLRTELRDTKEKELWRTRWYEPPDLAEEVHAQAQGKISRLFDIWSMGCVIFESALWLLYGFDSINDFLRTTSLVPNEHYATPYWRKLGDGWYEVSETASRWMKDILENDPERNCAIGHLIELVRDRLLKISLPPDSEIYSEGFRTNATDLKDQLGKIIARAESDEEYLYAGADRSKFTTPPVVETGTKQASQSKPNSFLVPEDAKRRGPVVVRGRATTISQEREYTNTIADKWKTSNDDDFVRSRIGDCKLPSSKPYLCEACDDIDILSGRVSFVPNTIRSNAIAQRCDLCELVYRVVKDMEIEANKNIVLTKSADCFVLRGTENKVLRLCITDTSKYHGISSHTTLIRKVEATQNTKDIPIGAPTLCTAISSDPSADSLDAFIKLPKEWLRECDIKHGAICTPRHGNQHLPKRLINVSNPGKPRIVESKELKTDLLTVNYVALSHKWGKMPNDAVSTKQNLEQRKRRIPLNELPVSFKNAIAITGALGLDYLWIDSLCINQGPDGDFAEQADTMQNIFSGAYCVIAACNSENATDGFLKGRELKCIKMGDVFVSAVTNDFERDVLQSPLNRRGWVLQERALARRTIFFTNSQMYWECGDGVRCETLAKLKKYVYDQKMEKLMSNKACSSEAAFLGDPNFPDYTIRADSTTGEQIHLFTKLFQRYSKLEFSHIEDRPIAIDGLMHRLTRAFRTQSLAGLFETFWGRCLLWQRAEGAPPLKKIPLGDHTRRTPPSWSWMAYDGPISFFEPKGGEVDWNERDVVLPFANRTQSSWLKTSHMRDSNAISAPVFEFANVEHSKQGEAYLSYDCGKMAPTTPTKCVIIGSEKQQTEDPDKRKHYVILVLSSTQANGDVSYERAGVGYLLGKFIRFANPEVISIE